MAHITEEWIVDEYGEFIEKGSIDVGDVTHRPRVGSSDFHFICDTCGTDARTDVGKLCSVCREPQFETPSGMCCSNGHRRAPSIES